MSFYDIVMLVVLLAAVLFGYWKGLAWQIASVAAVVVSYFVAVKFRDQVASYIQAEPPFNRIGAMLIIFVACSLLIWVAYAWVSKSLEKAELDGFNRQMGALIGGVTGILLCMVITMFSVSLLGERAHDSIHQSKIGPYMVRGIWQVSSILPDELKPHVDPHLEDFKNNIGHPPDGTLNNYPDYNTANGQSGLGPFGVNFGGDSNGQNSGSFTFTPGSQQSFQGNWTNSQTEQSGFTSTGENGRTQTSQGSTGLPSFNIEVDPNKLLPEAGEWLKNKLTDPNNAPNNGFPGGQ
jgi:membrane protein required for colicin V production